MEGGSGGRRWRAWTGVIAVVASLPLLSPAPPAAGAESRHRVVLFQTFSTSWDVLAVHDDGRCLTPYFRTEYNESTPAWSPDGDRIALAHRPGGTASIYTVQADATGLRRVTDAGGNDYGASWSPDATRLAFHSNRDQSWHLDTDVYTIGVDGSGMRRLTSGGRSSYPAWSPDGATIAYLLQRTGEIVIELVPAQGGAIRRVDTGDVRGGVPSWSPDGAWLGFAGAKSGAVHASAYVVRPDGSGLRQVSPPDARDSAVSFTPDGRLVGIEAGQRVWVMDVDGSNRRVLASGNSATRPAMSPATSAATVGRLAGGDRWETAGEVALISRQRVRPGVPSPPALATAAVLARGDDRGGGVDALAGVPLAAAVDGPLLLTPPDALPHPLSRFVPVEPGGTIHIVGGTASVSQAIEDDLRRRGFQTRRYAGQDRYETAVRVAEDGLGSPDTILLTSGRNFADALSAGPAAVASEGAILLTSGDQMPDVTRRYLLDHLVVRRYAIGGPAAAADPIAFPLVGSDRFDTSAKVATHFFPAPPAVGVASGHSFADGLSGGVLTAVEHGPMLLTARDGLPPSVRGYLLGPGQSAVCGRVYGGTAVVSETVRAAIARTLSG